MDQSTGCGNTTGMNHISSPDAALALEESMLGKVLSFGGTLSSMLIRCQVCFWRPSFRDIQVSNYRLSVTSKHWSLKGPTEHEGDVLPIAGDWECCVQTRGSGNPKYPTHQQTTTMTSPTESVCVLRVGKKSEQT